MTTVQLPYARFRGSRVQSVNACVRPAVDARVRVPVVNVLLAET